MLNVFGSSLTYPFSRLKNVEISSDMEISVIYIYGVSLCRKNQLLEIIEMTGLLC